MAHIAVHLNADIVLVVSAVRYNNNRCVILTFNLKDIGLLTHFDASLLVRTLEVTADVQIPRREKSHLVRLILHTGRGGGVVGPSCLDKSTVGCFDVTRKAVLSPLSLRWTLDSTAQAIFLSRRLH